MARAASIGAAVFALTGLSCRTGAPLRDAPLPPGITLQPGVYSDTCPRWSPDGKEIAFLRATTDRLHQLFIASADLGRVRAVGPPTLIWPDREPICDRAAGIESDAPEWSPDGRLIALGQLAWHSVESGARIPGTSLFAFGAESLPAPLARIAPDPFEPFYAARAPRWSPDGRRIAYLADRHQGGARVQLRTIPGTSPDSAAAILDAGVDSGWPAWSRDGKRLAFRHAHLAAGAAKPVEAIRVIEPGGPFTFTRFLKQTAALNSRNDPTWMRASGLAWSPDGRFLALSVTTQALRGAPYRAAVIALEGTGVLRYLTTEQEGDVHVIRWSAGSTIAGLRVRRGRPEAILISPRTGEIRARAIPSSDMDWSPDGSRVVFAGPEGSRRRLRVIRFGAR